MHRFGKVVKDRKFRGRKKKIHINLNYLQKMKSFQKLGNWRDSKFD